MSDSDKTMPMPYSNPTVMVVDDDLSVANLVATILRRVGFDVVIVGDGETALRYLSVSMPIALILDINLSGMDGIEVCRQVRADPVTSHIRVLILSGQKTRETVERAREAGVDDFAVKPIDPDILISKITAITPGLSSRESRVINLAPDDNRRRYIRFPVQADAMLHMELEMLDIGEGGLGFLSNTPVLPGTILQLKLPVMKEILGYSEITVKICYCMLPRLRKQYHLGTEFTDLSETDRKKLRQYVFKRQIARARPKG